MLDVVPGGTVWTLHADQVLVFASPAFQQKPIHVFFALVLVSLDAVPPQDKMLGNVVDARSHQADGDIMPGHAGVLGLAKFIVQPVVDVLEIHDPAVVEVLPGPDVFIQVSRVRICQWMFMNVVPTETEVETANEGDFVVDDDELFMVRLAQFLALVRGLRSLPESTNPVQGYIRQILKRIMIRVPDHMDIAMAW